MTQDETTRVAELRELVENFVAERQWRRFHAPKNLAMSLAIEAAELMEHFQWIDVEASRQAGDDPRTRSEIADELADVLCYALAMANALDIDVTTAIREKMVKNQRKYPVGE